MPNALEKRFETARYNADIVTPVAAESVWEKRISNHVAYALLMYTGLQIFVVMQAIRGDGASILPYMGLVALVGIVIPLCRRVEKRWQRLARSGASEAERGRAYRGDRLGIWLFAIGFPFGFVALLKGLSALI